MTQYKSGKGAKFAAKPANEQGNGMDNKPFEIEIPKRIRDLIRAEEGQANLDIESFVKNRRDAFNRASRYILQGALATMEGIPEGLQLRPNEDYTKLIQQ